MGAAIEVERVLGELGETPLEPLKEEKEEGTEETIMEKQVNALNETFVNFFKGVVSNQEASSSSTVIGGCQICKGGDHLATTCPRLNEARPKCTKCGMPHRIENYRIKCTYCLGLGHSEDRCWKKPKDGKSPSGAANFLEVLLSDEAATLQQLNKLCGSENLFSHTRVPRKRIPVEVAAGGADPTPNCGRWAWRRPGCCSQVQDPLPLHQRQSLSLTDGNHFAHSKRTGTSGKLSEVG